MTSPPQAGPVPRVRCRTCTSGAAAPRSTARRRRRGESNRSGRARSPRKPSPRPNTSRTGRRSSRPRGRSCRTSHTMDPAFDQFSRQVPALGLGERRAVLDPLDEIPGGSHRKPRASAVPCGVGQHIAPVRRPDEARVLAAAGPLILLRRVVRGIQNRLRQGCEAYSVFAPGQSESRRVAAQGRLPFRPPRGRSCRACRRPRPRQG